MKSCTVEITSCGVFFPNIKEKPWLMLIQGVIFCSLLILKCQRGVLTRCKLSWLTNLMFIWLWSQKNRFSWCYFPIYSWVSCQIFPSACLKFMPQDQKQDATTISPFFGSSHSTTVFMYNISWKKLSGWFFNTYLEATLKYFWMK